MRHAIGAGGAVLLLALSSASLARAQEPTDEDYGPTEDRTEVDLGIDNLNVDPGIVSGVDGVGQPSTAGSGQPGDPGAGVPGGQAAPPRNAIPASTDVESIQPGDTVVVTPRPSGSAPAFQPGSTPSVGVAAGNGAAAPPFEATIHTDAAGNVTISVTVGADTPEGVYYVYVTGVDAAGDTVTYVADVTVSPAAAMAPASAAQSVAAASVKRVRAPRHEGLVPAPVQALSLTPEREDEIVEAVVSDGAELTIEGNELVLRRRADDLDEGRPLLAALVVAAVGGSLALLRRRPAARRAVAR